MPTLKQWEDGEVTHGEMMIQLLSDLTTVVMHMKNQDEKKYWYRLQFYGVWGKYANISDVPPILLTTNQAHKLNLYLSGYRFYSELAPAQ